MNTFKRNSTLVGIDSICDLFVLPTTSLKHRYRFSTGSFVAFNLMEFLLINYQTIFSDKHLTKI